jgi:hypothetical protein
VLEANAAMRVIVRRNRGGGCQELFGRLADLNRPQRPRRVLAGACISGRLGALLEQKLGELRSTLYV